MTVKVNDNWDLAGNGLGSTTHIVEVVGPASVEDVIKGLMATHTIAGVSGNFLAVQGDAVPAGADFSVVATFA